MAVCVEDIKGAFNIYDIFMYLYINRLQSNLDRFCHIFILNIEICNFPMTNIKMEVGKHTKLSEIVF